MSDRAICVTGLGKYFSGRRRRSTRGLHETFERVARVPLWGRGSPARSRSDGRWALRHVSFDIQRGASVGVLGANGAGKSVLLKILSRITAPTEGQAELCGHVGPLLELGAGFHPELSGRDNIYFNGAILGMTRAQIHRRFDAIVAFSEIEAFIDTPFKLYSSGMRMRLAFSVAVHVEPEILLIDEALGVGDAAFRAKCRRAIASSVARGCTVLLVSHDAALVADMCSRAILLDRGQLVDDGAVNAVLDRYRDTLDPPTLP